MLGRLSIKSQDIHQVDLGIDCSSLLHLRLCHLNYLFLFSLLQLPSFVSGLLDLFAPDGFLPCDSFVHPRNSFMNFIFFGECFLLSVFLSFFDAHC